MIRKICLIASLFFSPLAHSLELDVVIKRNAALKDSAKLLSAFNNTKAPLFWLFLGDSITHGCLHTKGGRNYVEHFTEFARWEAHRTKRKNDLVLNAGVSGETAAGFLTQAKWRLEQFKPQVVFINFGTNDVRRRPNNIEQYEKDLTKIVKMVRSKRALPVLCVPNTMITPHADEQKFYAVVRKVADKQDCLLVDHAGHWTELNGGDEKANKKWMNDKIHPNAAGQLLMAQTIIRSLGLDKGHEAAAVLRKKVP